MLHSNIPIINGLLCFDTLEHFLKLGYFSPFEANNLFQSWYLKPGQLMKLTILSICFPFQTFTVYQVLPTRKKVLHKSIGSPFSSTIQTYVY